MSDIRAKILALRNMIEERLKKWPHRAIRDALARITELEARLAAAEALALEYEHRHQRALSLLHKAEAREDALAEALRSYRADLCEGFCLEAEWSDEAHDHPALPKLRR